MSKAGEVAWALVDYDRRVATHVLALICAELGGPVNEGDLDLNRMKAFLSQPDGRGLAEVGDPQTTTAEWKAEFAHYEGMRALGAELADLLE